MCWGDRKQVEDLRKEVLALQRRITIGNQQCQDLVETNRRLRKALQQIMLGGLYADQMMAIAEIALDKRPIKGV